MLAESSEFRGGSPKCAEASRDIFYVQWQKDLPMSEQLQQERDRRGVKHNDPTMMLHGSNSFGF